MRTMSQAGRGKEGEEEIHHHSFWCKEWSGDNDSFKGSRFKKGGPDRYPQSFPFYLNLIEKC